jgi:hypothetical protein
MDNTVKNELDLDQRKAQIKAKLEQSRLLIRNDVNDLKEDLNPLQAAGNLVKQMLNPAPAAQLTNSGIVNFTIDTGISILINRFLPGANKNLVQVVAPVLVKNLASNVVPKLRKTAETALEWVVEKTNKKS